MKQQKKEFRGTKNVYLKITGVTAESEKWNKLQTVK